MHIIDRKYALLTTHISYHFKKISTLNNSLFQIYLYMNLFIKK